MRKGGESFLEIIPISAYFGNINFQTSYLSTSVRNYPSMVTNKQYTRQSCWWYNQLSQSFWFAAHTNSTLRVRHMINFGIVGKDVKSKAKKQKKKRWKRTIVCMAHAGSLRSFITILHFQRLFIYILTTHILRNGSARRSSILWRSAIKTLSSSILKINWKP